MHTTPPNAVVGAYEAKMHFSELLARAASGEEITITRYATPVARLVPIQKRSTQQECRTAIERIVELREGRSLNGLKIRDLVHAGRR